MSQMDTQFLDRASQTLFHYTGVGALLGIANTSSIWASNVYYLNDSKEVVHACDALEEAIKPQVVFGQLTSAERAFTEQFQRWSGSFRNTTYNLFVFSLSEERSLLSQWRSYTPHGKGISIGFPPGLINRLIAENRLKLAKCLYKPIEHQQVLSDLFQKLLRAFRAHPPQINGDAQNSDCYYYPFLETFRGEILQALAIIKHPSFAEEREWRLVSEYFPSYVAPQIRFREGASMLVPFIELSLGTRRPLFETVILGPSPHEELSFSALHMFLANKQLCNTTENSHIPYREW